MPKKRKQPRKGVRSTRAPGSSPTRPREISLGGPVWPSKGWAFRRLVETAAEQGQPFPELTGKAPEGYSSDFVPQRDAPRAPLQGGWYLRTDLEVPVYIWVYPLEDLADDPDEMDLRARGYVFYKAHSVLTRGRADAAHAVPDEMAAWVPIAVPDPEIVAADRYGPLPSVYRTKVAGPLPDQLPSTIAVVDVDYSRVAGQSLPEKWDVDLVGVLIVERVTDGVPPGHGQWRQAAFHVLRDDQLGDLSAVLDEADLILGHNLFDGDYRCLRTYDDRLDLAPLVGRTVDTLYAARQVVSQGFIRADGLGLTSLSRSHGLRARAKQLSRTEAHRGIVTIDDAEDRWSFQSIADDCELMLELWLTLLEGRFLRVQPNSADSPVAHALDDSALSLLLDPPLTYEEYVRRLTTRGTVYRLPGQARHESVARIHRGLTSPSVAAPASAEPRHRPRSTTQRCMAPVQGDHGQCRNLVHDGGSYCRQHRRMRLCRGNPALHDPCTLPVHGDETHCRWHRMTALYLPPGRRIHEDFTLPLPLPGWDEASDWGYDIGTISFFARLYRNGTDAWGDPTVWLSGTSPDLANSLDLRDAIALATHRPPVEVTRALTAERAVDD